VMYHGTDNQDELTAMKFAIARSAEIASREDYPYFRIDSSKTVEKQVLKSYMASDPYYPYGPYGWNSGSYYRPYYDWDGWADDYNTYTYVETQPVVRLTVTLERSACEKCYSTDKKIEEAQASGILSENKDKG
jgi:hypothetical protein